ncbi:MAG: riboflavin synthase [Gammaproteobacteria bacterium]
MFTGIVEAVGYMTAVTDMAGGLRVVIDAGPLDLGDVRIGDSIAVQGVCLTVVDLTGGGFAVDVSRETLRCTTLGECHAGARVNLEKALCLCQERGGGRLGGHFVTGHVDGIGTVASAQPRDSDAGMRVVVPEALVRYLARKGSVCVDGTSLTVNRIEGREFEVHLIPHTLSATIAGSYRAGTRVNIEVDLLARYVESLLSASVVAR